MKRAIDFLALGGWIPFSLAFWCAWLVVDLTAEPIRGSAAAVDAVIIVLNLLHWRHARRRARRTGGAS